MPFQDGEFGHVAEKAKTPLTYKFLICILSLLFILTFACWR